MNPAHATIEEDDWQELVGLFLEARLSPEQTSKLESICTASPARLQELADAQNTDLLLSTLGRSHSEKCAAADRIMLLLASESRRTLVGKRVVKSLRRRAIHQTRLTGALLAASVLIAATLGIIAWKYMSVAPSEIGLDVVAIKGELQGSSAASDWQSIGNASVQKPFVWKSGAQLRLRDNGAVAATAEVQFADGSTLLIREKTTVTLKDIAPALIVVDAGEIACSVTHTQSSQRPLRWIVRTPTAEIRVIGTQFRVAASETLSRLEVLEGGVQFQRLSDAKSIDVHAGYFAVAAAGVELVARPIPAAPVAPAHGPWPLFGKDLSGWRVMKGEWKIENGMITGHSGNDPHARIESLDSFEDYELTCKLRVSGGRLAEVQTGGYRAFFPLSWDTPGEWKNFVLRVRGSTMRATVDGHEVKFEVGNPDDDAPLGALAFYVAANGTLDIKDATWTELGPEK